MLIAGCMQAASAGRAADAAPPKLLGAEAVGECTVSGTVQFPSGLPTRQPFAANLSVSGNCQGAFIAGNMVQISFSSLGAGIGSCVALEGDVDGSITFSSGTSGFNGVALLSGDLSDLQLTPLQNTNTVSDDFAGVLDLVVTTTSATLDCVHNQLGTVNVTGVLLVASV